jgi:cell division protein ZapE
MSGVKARYQALVAAGELRPDRDQRRAVEALAELAFKLENAPRRGSVLWFLPGRKVEPVKAPICGAGSGAASRC